MRDKVAIEFLNAGLDLLVAVIIIVATALVGRFLTAKWNFHQKRKEQNLESVRALHDLYGEFKEVLKIWRVIKDKEKPIHITPETRLDLLTRACAVEGKTEALVLRLASERKMDEGQPIQIGMFRQAIQSLRQSIRDDKTSPFGDRDKVEYSMMNELAAQVSAIVTADLPPKEIDSATTMRQLAEIVSVRSENWDIEVAARNLSAKAGEPSEPGTQEADSSR